MRIDAYNFIGITHKVLIQSIQLIQSQGITHKKNSTKYVDSYLTNYNKLFFKASIFIYWFKLSLFFVAVL